MNLPSLSGEPLLLDSSLLVLFLVGSLDENLIGRHRRTREFVVEDYWLLLRLMEPFRRLLVTPNILTETSNHLEFIGEPNRQRLLRHLGQFVQLAHEEYVPSTDAVAVNEFRRLGLPDSATVDRAMHGAVVLTVDFDLYQALSVKGVPVYNFNHIRTAGWQ